MKLVPHGGGVKALLENPLSDHEIGLAWLGQAGFALRHANCRLLIDPYLSDHLARKYEGTEFPHLRMMPTPLEPGQARNLDFVLCSHRHGDHMDPSALPELAQNNARCWLVVPRAERESAIKLGLSESRLILANDGDAIPLNDSIELHVVPAAHETLQMNDRGEHRFLGFILRLGGTTIYHSGDSVVYKGMAERLGKSRIDLALLPVNGRSERLNSRGISGNMNFDEACELCLAAGIGTMIPHHWGMFAFNTADPKEIRRQIAGLDAARLQCVLPDAGLFYTLAG